MLIQKVKNLRKKFLIEPILQKRIILNFGLLGLTMIFLNMLTVYLLVNKLISQIESMSQVHSEMYSLLMDTWAYLILSSLVLSVLIIVGFCAYGLILSNRIAGPIYNLRKALDAVLKGEKNIVIQFRKDDYFQDLSTQVNELITRLSPKE